VSASALSKQRSGNENRTTTCCRATSTEATPYGTFVHRARHCQGRSCSLPDAALDGESNRTDYTEEFAFFEGRTRDEVEAESARGGAELRCPKFAEVHRLSTREIVARLSAKSRIRVESGSFVGRFRDEEYKLGPVGSGLAQAIRRMSEFRRARELDSA
jgi:hypothetical protein